MDRRRRTAVVRMVITVSLTAALAACGPQGPADQPAPPAESAVSPTPTATVAPEELLQQAVRNTLDAPSKRLVGSAAVPVGSQAFDIVYVDGNAMGTQTARAMGLESVVEFVRVGDSLYILATEAYWQNYVNLERLALVSRKWVLVAADHPNHEPLLVPVDATEFAQAVDGLTDAGTDRVEGTAAVVLADADGNRFFVSAEGTPYLLRVEATQETEVGEATVELTYSQFGAVTETITVPEGEIVDLR